MRLLSIALVFSFLSACFFPADRGRVVEGRLDALTQENLKLQAQLKETQDRLIKTSNQLDETSATLAKSAADSNVKLDAAMQDIAMLRGQLESSQHKGSEFEQKLQELSANQATAQAAAAKADEGKPVEPPKKDELKRPENPEDYLALAREKVKAGEVELGRKLFTEYMKKWPRDDEMGEAHFALGETYFNDAKCREALFEYSKVIQDFSKTKSAASAYLRSGDCFRDLKMVAESKLAFEELIKQFPKSDSAKTAKARLVDLAKTPAKKGTK